MGNYTHLTLTASPVLSLILEFLQRNPQKFPQVGPKQCPKLQKSESPLRTALSEGELGTIDKIVRFQGFMRTTLRSFSEASNKSKPSFSVYNNYINHVSL